MEHVRNGIYQSLAEPEHVLGIRATANFVISTHNRPRFPS